MLVKYAHFLSNRVIKQRTEWGWSAIKPQIERISGCAREYGTALEYHVLMFTTRI
jgi:hypothetical protein